MFICFISAQIGLNRKPGLKAQSHRVRSRQAFALLSQTQRGHAKGQAEERHLAAARRAGKRTSCEKPAVKSTASQGLWALGGTVGVECISSGVTSGKDGSQATT